MSPTALRLSRRLVLVTSALAMLALSLATQFSYGGLSATVRNTVNSAGSSTLLYTHTYSGGTCTSVPSSGPIPATAAFPCPGSLLPGATTATGTVAGTADAIAYRGAATAAQTTQRAAVTSCGAVNLVNSATAADPLLARYGTTFAPAPATPPMSGAGAITVDGANPGGYETAVATETTNNMLLSVGTSAGLGIWFKTNSVAGGALLGLGSSAANATSTTYDRVLSMNPNGTLSFVQNTSGAANAVTTTTKKYNDGGWHFAYVRMTSVSAIGLGVSSQTAITVDGDAAVTGGGLLIPYSATTGYWHVGWSPVTSGSAYFAGSLSNAAVFNASPAPAAPSGTQRASQAAFDTWSAAATQHWPLNDPGTTTFAGTYPASTTVTDPCATINAAWSFAGPASCAFPNSTTAGCAAPSRSVTAWRIAGPQRIASPTPSRSPVPVQTATMSVARGTGYDVNFEPGLRLYTPLNFTASAGGWVNSFTWSDQSSAFIA